MNSVSGCALLKLWASLGLEPGCLGDDFADHRDRQDIQGVG
jgi:hypothetical protein